MGYVPSPLDFENANISLLQVLSQFEFSGQTVREITDMLVENAGAVVDTISETAALIKIPISVASSALVGGAKSLVAAVSVEPGSAKPAGWILIASAIGVGLANLAAMGISAFNTDAIATPEIQDLESDLSKEQERALVHLSPEKMQPWYELSALSMTYDMAKAYLTTHELHETTIGGSFTPFVEPSVLNRISVESYKQRLGTVLQESDVNYLMTNIQSQLDTFPSSYTASSNLDDYYILIQFGVTAGVLVRSKIQIELIPKNYYNFDTLAESDLSVFKYADREVNGIETIKYSAIRDNEWKSYVGAITKRGQFPDWRGYEYFIEVLTSGAWIATQHTRTSLHPDGYLTTKVSPDFTIGETQYKVNNFDVAGGTTVLTDDVITVQPEDYERIINSLSFEAYAAMIADKLSKLVVGGKTYVGLNAGAIRAGEELKNGVIDDEDVPLVVPGLAIPTLGDTVRDNVIDLPITQAVPAVKYKADAIAQEAVEAATKYPNPITPPSTYVPIIPTLTPTTTTGLFKIYNPTEAQVRTFGQWLWSTDISLDALKRLFVNPMDAVIGFYKTFVKPETSASAEYIKIGYISSSAQSKVVTNQFVDFDCGFIDVSEFFGNALDYDNRTSLEIYLPFIGFQQLSNKDIVGKRLELKYKVDIMTGSCLAYLSAGGSMIATYSGSMNYTMPLTSSDYINAVKAVVGVGASAITGGAVGAATAALSGGASLLGGGLQNIQKSGNFGGSNAILSPRKPYLIIRRAKPYIAGNYNKLSGVTDNRFVKLRDCVGYTVVSAVHVENIPKSERSDRDAIEAALKAGVII